VVISKFDGIEDLSVSSDNPMSGTITPGLAVTRDPMTNSHATSESLADLQDNIRVNNEAIAILERLRAGDFLTLVKNKLPMAQYFVVSALGHASYNDKMDSAGISSFRISDPLRWAAATLNQAPAPVASQNQPSTIQSEEVRAPETNVNSVIAPSPVKEDMILSQESPEYEEVEEEFVEVEIPEAPEESEDVIVEETEEVYEEEIEEVEEELEELPEAEEDLEVELEEVIEPEVEQTSLAIEEDVSLEPVEETKPATRRSRKTAAQDEV
jgi:hypothetical protein